ncbi:MAG: hypothetical protein QXX30_04180 [Candidatus Aenigmatarchaeota archaeon]
MKKKKKVNNKVLIFVTVFSLLLLLILVISNNFSILYDKEIVKIVGRAYVFDPRENITIGFSNEPNVLDFGIIPGNGSYSKKYLQLENFYDKKVKVDIEVLGNISSKVYVKEKTFWLNEKEKKTVEIFFFTNDTISGYYEGEFFVYIKKPKISMIYKIENLFR